MTKRKQDTGDDDVKEIPKKKYICKRINIKISTIDDLIYLGELHNPKSKVRYNINIESLYHILPSLRELKNLIGMDKIKKNIVSQILYFLQNLHEGNLDMLHTVIQGPPGVGKTEVARIIAKIYSSMGILDNDIFISAKRSDLIGQYLGETAIKTQKIINLCRGGVLLIDEAYSLGNKEGRDSYSKECIDTLNQNLTENKHRFMCIIVGYKDALEKCFFSVNPGLARRFNIRYTIEAYSPEELKNIMIAMIRKTGWSIKEPISDNLPDSFFIKNKSEFPNFGGDIETLFFNMKLYHSRRVFLLEDSEKKILTIDDLNGGFEEYKTNQGKEKPEEHPSYLRMYI